MHLALENRCCLRSDPVSSSKMRTEPDRSSSLYRLLFGLLLLQCCGTLMLVAADDDAEPNEVTKGAAVENAGKNAGIEEAAAAHGASHAEDEHHNNQVAIDDGEKRAEAAEKPGENAGNYHDSHDSKADDGHKPFKPEGVDPNAPTPKVNRKVVRDVEGMRERAAKGGKDPHHLPDPEEKAVAPGNGKTAAEGSKPRSLLQACRSETRRICGEDVPVAKCLAEQKDRVKEPVCLEWVHAREACLRDARNHQKCQQGPETPRACLAKLKLEDLGGECAASDFFKAVRAYARWRRRGDNSKVKK